MISDVPAIRVFLCDDVAELRLLMRLGLEDEPGFEIVGEADDGAATLSAIPLSKPHVVLLDLSMPGMDGLDVIAGLRRLAPATGIVVHSAYATPRVQAQALACGADQYLEKGASLERLREVTRQVALARTRSAGR